MLRALELNGFKSFADRTRFEFPPGVTVVVGPNGSGKSNIVDAVKWVLGAQSVKALRGKEMADVIFNGTGSRVPINTAEVTLTFDNSSGVLPLNTKDVLITRRVYRSGEGEYFINRSPCRLRDIRDLLAGTGIATDAYSIIEQGKVDVMLQSSPRDRRVLFEEAAGISRFKSKKAEAQRRLARVEQNLLRLADIVEEVDARLRKVRSQAAKARRYEDYTRRLKRLRLAAAGRELAALQERRLSCTHEARELTTRQEGLTQQVAVAARHSRDGEEKLCECEGILEQQRANAASLREQIARLWAHTDQHHSREHELDREIAQERRQLAKTNLESLDLARRCVELEAQSSKSRSLYSDATARLAAARDHVEHLQHGVQTFTARVKEARLRREAAATRSAAMERQISVLRSQAASAHAAEEKCRASASELADQKDTVSRQLADRLAAVESLSAQVEQFGKQLQASQQLAAQHRRNLARLQSEAGELKLRRHALLQRAAILEQLQKQLEGVGAGTKHVLLQSRATPEDQSPHVRGLLADLLHVDVEIAPLVELVLGHRANMLVVDSPAALTGLALHFRDELPGRAGFIAAEGAELEEEVAQPTAGEPGVIDRLDRLVETAPQNRLLVRKLLGRTWLVEDLPAALRLARTYPSIGFVTRDGDFVADDGAVLMGPKDGKAGILSRQSELVALARQMGEIDTQMTAVAQQIEQLESAVFEQERLSEALSPEHAALTGKLSEQRLASTAAEHRLQQVDALYEACCQELAVAEVQAGDIQQELSVSHASLQEAAAEFTEADAEFRQAEEQLDAQRARQTDAQQQLANVRVELATAEQKLQAQEGQLEAARRLQTETRANIDSGRRQLHETLRRRDQTRREALAATAELALSMLNQQQLLQGIEIQANEHHCLRQMLTEVRSQQDSLQSALRAAERTLQERELTARQIEHEMQLLVARYREEYEVDLTHFNPEGDDASFSESSEMGQEIAELRRKINNLGAVNLEALSELSDLETRHERLDQQLRDLTSAKHSLEQIIARINVDSRKLFLATIDVVRKHFQDLFRRLFGGGQADIVLEGEEDEDVLERGIEIVARPPGKEPRSISLLSGGEKTLTCVALLLAVFRSRPSPFCILDEVDAALDEANIERFASVLREFLHATQFIVVTHSKRTMTFADTLYGITMQETGISKPVSVRFDDRTSEVDGFEPQEAEETQAA